MAELIDYVEVLADQIGPRPVSTEEEHQASLYIAQELSDDGLDVDVDEFATPTGTRWPYAISFLLAILGTLVSGVGIFVRSISLTMFVVGIILIAAGFFIYYTETNGRPVLSRLRVGGVSQNVVARYVPSSVRREQRRRKVVVVAHVDTVRAELESMPALVKQAKLLRRIVFYVLIGIVVLTIVRLLPVPWPNVVDTVLWGISLVGCLYLLFATVCIVARRFTPYVSGANDNASSDAVLLGVAKAIVDPAERERHARKRRTRAARQARGAGRSRVQAGAEQADETEQAGAFSEGEEPEEYEDAELSEHGSAEAPVADATVVMHTAEQVVASGFVPEGAELVYEEYEEDGAYGDGLDAADAVSSEGVQAAVDAGTQSAAGASNVVAFPQSPYPEIVEDPAAQEAPATQGAPVASGAPVAPPAAPPAPRPAQGYQPLPEGLFAQTPEDAVDGQAGTAARTATQAASAPVPAEEAAVPRPAESQVSARAQGAPQAQSPQGEPETQPAPEPEPESNVPSWYAAAKRKAARDLQARGKEDAAKQEPEQYRSRYAQIPTEGSMERVREALSADAAAGAEGATQAQAPQENAAPSEASATPASDTPANAAPAAQPATVPAGSADAGASAQSAPQPAAASAQAAPESAQSAATPEPTRAAAEPAPIDFGFLDDEIDDIAPDMSGVFSAISDTEVIAAVPTPEPERAQSEPVPAPHAPVQAASEPAPERPAPPEPEHAPAADAGEVPATSKTGLLKGLTSRIPLISSADGGERHAQERHGRVERPEPVRTSRPKPERTAESKAEAKPKPERRKPTARHITQEFQPTKPADERDNSALSSMRQEAAVSSSYESTPQAGPEYDPFVPTDEQPFDAYGNPTSAFPSLAGRGVSNSAPSASDFGSTPGNSSSFPALSGSFPSLSGSFPALSGQMPQVNPNDFGSAESASFGYEPTSEDVADDFANPNLTGEIDIPDSRFHNAIDKVGGIFKHKEKKGKTKKERRAKGRKHHADPQASGGYDGFDDGNVDNWDEDDDFGWKGGAYVPDGYEGFDSEAEHDAARAGASEEPREHGRASSAFAAAKARAAEIRDSVVEMTENDLLDKEVWFVALGASGAGNQGMKNFLELHGSELRGALIINLEAVGAGELRYVSTEGKGKARACDRRLQSLVRKASKELDGTEMRSQSLDWRDTDATPAMAAGLRAMTIMGFDGPAPVAWHWSTDTSDIIDSDNLDYATELILSMIENS